MKAERAKEIIKNAQNTAKGYPWVDAIDKVMTTEERKEVCKIWDTLPGNYSFVDTLTYISKQLK